MNQSLWLLVSIHCFILNVYCIENYTEIEESPDKQGYLIGCDVAVSEIPESELPEFKAKLSKLFCLVFEKATHEKLGQSMRVGRLLNFSSELCQIKVEENLALKSHVQLIFIVTYDNVRVDASVATKELSRLTLSHLSATLGFPIISVYAINQTRYSPTIQWWIIRKPHTSFECCRTIRCHVMGSHPPTVYRLNCLTPGIKSITPNHMTTSVIIIGCCLLVCVCAWLVMFVYYNTCGLPLSQYDGYTTEQQQQTSQIDKSVLEELSDEPKNLMNSQRPATTLLSNDNVSTQAITGVDQIGHVEPTKQSPIIIPETVACMYRKPETTETEETEREQIPDPAHKTEEDKRKKMTEKQPEKLKEFPIPERWVPYYAGDRVQAIRLQEPRHQHPQPALPTEDGVLCLRSD